MRASATVFAFLACTAIASACGTSNNQDNGFHHGGSSSSSGGSSGGSSDGGFGAFGDSGGMGHDSGNGQPPHGCDSSCPAAGGSCVNNVCTISENPGGVDPGTQGALGGGGSADSQFAWLYPYDQTVFPRGLLPPTMQFGGTAADAMYVHITCASLDYKGWFKPASTHLALSDKVWTAVLDAASGPSDPLKVEVTKISGGAVTGPITESWPIAQGSLRGTIYYETYGSAIGGAVAVMRIDPGATKPVVMSLGAPPFGCGFICHTASADGSTLVVANGFTGPSNSYDLKNNASLLAAATDSRFVYGALYPNGSMSMSTTGYRTWFGLKSQLYSTANTSTPLSAPGWDGVITNAGVPAFSPDGKQIAFIHEDKDKGHTIAKMDFSVGNRTFSNLTDIATDPAHMLAWPSYTPDGKWVIYEDQTSAGGCPGSNGGTSTAPPFETDCNAAGELYAVDIASKTTKRLDLLDGYTGTGSATYLKSNDPGLDFAPTVLPEAVGGYFWVVFTSHRAYGDMIPSKAGNSAGNDDRGQLWVAAIDINATAGKDSSHPAFYFDGQEATANNLRGFWVLPPCKANGQSCTSGDQCCNGFCRPAGDGGPLECVPPPGGCSNEYESCSTASDCCNPSDQCINGRCAQPAAQ